MANESYQNKRKWLFIGVYKPSSQSDKECSNWLILVIDHYLSKNENVILIGDVNPSTENRYLDEVIKAYNLINEPTY